MTELPIVLLVFLGAMTFVVGQLCLFAYDLSAGRKQIRHRIELFAARLQSPSRPRAGAATASAANRGLTAVGLHGDQLELARNLEPFHISPQAVPWLYVGLRSATAAVLAGALVGFAYRYVGTGAPINLMALGVAGVSLGWLIPHLVVGRLAANHRHAIGRGLPDAIELLVIAVEAGLSLEEAINRIVSELQRSQPAIAEELATTSADLRILPNRDDALRRLADRVNLPSVQSVVTTLSQTMRYGTPLAQALRVVAAELRNDSLLKLEEQANRMPVLLTVPMILFILPSLFLIIGGPAFLRVMDLFAR